MKNVKYFNSKKIFYFKTMNHALWILHHCFVVYYGIIMNLKSSAIKRVRMLEEYAPAFVTQICFGLQIGYLMLALACDLAQRKGSVDPVLYGKWMYWRDVLFNALVMPYSVLVATMFWGLYWIDRELIFPVIYDEEIPGWMNHCTHTSIVFVVVFEALLQPRREPVDRKLETKIYLWCTAIYSAMYYTIFLTKGDWLYPIHEIMTWWQICIYQAVVWFSVDIFYKIQFPINRFICCSYNKEEELVNGIQDNFFDVKVATSSTSKDVINVSKREEKRR